MEDHVTTREDLRRWFDEGVEQKADYMIIVTDTFELSDSPVYVTNGGERSVHELAQSYENDEKMTRVMEVYDLHADRDMQVAQHRTWAIPKPTPSPMTRVVNELVDMLNAGDVS